MFAARLFRNIRMDPGARPGEYLGARLKRPGVRHLVPVRLRSDSCVRTRVCRALCTRSCAYMCMCVCMWRRRDGYG